MGLKFDKAKPHGTVYGHPNVSHEQDGHMFRPDGTEYVEEPSTIGTATSNTLRVPERRDGLR
jgi:hypothetical protein